MIYFSDGKILGTLLMLNVKMFKSITRFVGIRGPEGGLPKIGIKVAKVFSLKRRFDVLT